MLLGARQGSLTSLQEPAQLGPSLLENFMSKPSSSPGQNPVFALAQLWKPKTGSASLVGQWASASSAPSTPCALNRPRGDQHPMFSLGRCCVSFPATSTRLVQSTRKLTYQGADHPACAHPPCRGFWARGGVPGKTELVPAGRVPKPVPLTGQPRALLPPPPQVLNGVPQGSEGHPRTPCVSINCSLWPRPTRPLG